MTGTGPGPQGARACAATILARVIRHHQTLDRVLAVTDPVPDAALVRELCYGTLRWYPRLSAILDQLLHKPLRKRDLELRVLLLAGLYQLEYLSIAQHAAVSETVQAARELNRPWGGPLVNAALRRFLREREPIGRELEKLPGARYAHPDWFIDVLRQDWPHHWEAILDGNNQRPPLQLRVNLRRCDRDGYLAQLTRAGLTGRPAAHSACGVEVHPPVEVSALPGFDTGLVSVQDFGAQLAAGLLDLRPGLRVLDACAAPGGKTGHISETAPDLGLLTAVDYDKRRVELLLDTKRRLNFDADIVHADARDTGSWWQGTGYDRILLDAPCSASGVIRRHPDIKLLRTAAMLERYTTTQAELLQALWPVLIPGGRLLYSTCSLLRRENDEQVGDFLRRHDDASIIPTAADWGVATDYGRQTLPGLDDSDGFFYALLEKNRA